jgi:hypothetical protein
MRERSAVDSGISVTVVLMQIHKHTPSVFRVHEESVCFPAKAVARVDYLSWKGSYIFLEPLLGRVPKMRRYNFLKALRRYNFWNATATFTVQRRVCIGQTSIGVSGLDCMPRV